jgi:hypothetical protein
VLLGRITSCRGLIAVEWARWPVVYHDPLFLIAAALVPVLGKRAAFRPDDLLKKSLPMMRGR